MYSLDKNVCVCVQCSPMVILRRGVPFSRSTHHLAINSNKDVTSIEYLHGVVLRYADFGMCEPREY